MSVRATVLAYAVSIVSATLLWTAAALTAGKAEPWDAPAYWTLAYPMSVALSAVLGWAFPEKAWRWALAVTLVQAPVMLARGAGAGLLPLGLVLMLALSMPAMAAAAGIAALRRRVHAPGD